MKRICTLFSICIAAALFASAAPAADIALSPMEQLGKFLYFDKISEPGSMACADCHAPRTGFTGPIPGINKHGAVYRGASPRRFGNRKPPSAAYATLSPIFHYDAGEGLFKGGNFWDGRATGEVLGNPAADQALGPFLNPVEQNNPSKLAVIEKVAASKYAWLWEQVWGEPISTVTPGDVAMNYDRIGLAIAAFEDRKITQGRKGAMTQRKPMVFGATASTVTINTRYSWCPPNRGNSTTPLCASASLRHCVDF